MRASGLPAEREYRVAYDHGAAEHANRKGHTAVSPSALSVVAGCPFIVLNYDTADAPTPCLDCRPRFARPAVVLGTSSTGISARRTTSSATLP